jgi:DNA-binding LacI/PurR family transcriptional regulator
VGYRHKNRARLGPDRVLRRIGLVMAGNAAIVARPFYASLLAGAAAECAAMDMTITYCPVSGASGAARLEDAGVDGLVLAGYLAPDLEAQLAALRMPSVVVNNRPSLPTDRVVFDDADGGRLAAHLLLCHGHRRLAVLHDPLHRGVLHDRLTAFRAAVTGANPEATIVAHEVPPNGDLPGSGYEVALAALGCADGQEAQGGGQDTLPTGVFCTSDRIALGALKALWDLGRPVPGSVSVVGFNDFEAAAHANPPLTTVRADMELMGRVAVRRLLERAREPETPPMAITIGVSLVERRSVGPAPP